MAGQKRKHRPRVKKRDEKKAAEKVEKVEEDDIIDVEDLEERISGSKNIVEGYRQKGGQ